MRTSRPTAMTGVACVGTNNAKMRVENSYPDAPNISELRGSVFLVVSKGLLG